MSPAGFFQRTHKHKTDRGRVFSLFSLFEIVVVAILLCSLVTLPNYVNAQPAPTIPDPSDSYEFYKDELNSISILYPSNWTVNSAPVTLDIL